MTHLHDSLSYPDHYPHDSAFVCCGVAHRYLSIGRLVAPALTKELRARILDNLRGEAMQVAISKLSQHHDALKYESVLKDSIVWRAESTIDGSRFKKTGDIYTARPAESLSYTYLFVVGFCRPAGIAKLGELVIPPDEYLEKECYHTADVGHIFPLLDIKQFERRIFTVAGTWPIVDSKHLAPLYTLRQTLFERVQ